MTIKLDPGEWTWKGQPLRIIQRVRDFAQLQSAIDAMDPQRRFVFRGYSAPRRDEPVEAPEALKTGLERACLALDGGLQHAPRREAAIVREFMRRAHHYLSDVPEKENWIEWLALMQHHGAPTRLLDWTYSRHVAAYFALSHASRQPDADLAIWAVNPAWCATTSGEICSAVGRFLTELSKRFLRRDTEGGASKELLGGPPLPPCVWPISPFRLNERLTLQKGLFLAPGTVSVPFGENFFSLAGSDSGANVTIFVLPRAEAPNLARELWNMNLTDATLFPGLDGFARSLWTAPHLLDMDKPRGFMDL